MVDGKTMMLGADDRLTGSQLRWFGLSLAVMLWCVAGWLYWRYAFANAAGGIAALGVLLLAIYYGIPATRPSIIRGFRRLTWPIQWVVSLVLLGILFFGVITPIGCVMRCLGRDPLSKSPRPQQSSYWTPYPQATDTRSYFRLY